MWLFIGILLGSIVTSSHDTKEACEGRRVVLTEKGVNGQCVNQNIGTYSTTITGPYIYCQGNGLCGSTSR